MDAYRRRSGIAAACTLLTGLICATGVQAAQQVDTLESMITRLGAAMEGPLAARADALASLRAVAAGSFPDLLEASHRVPPSGPLYAWEVIGARVRRGPLLPHDRSWIAGEAGFARGDEDPLTRNAAAETLASLGDPRGVDTLLDDLDARVFPRLDAWRRLRRTVRLEEGFSPHAGSRERARQRKDLHRRWALVRERFGTKDFTWPPPVPAAEPAGPGEPSSPSPYRPAPRLEGDRRAVWAEARRLAGEDQLEKALGIYEWLCSSGPPDVSVEVEHALTLHQLGRDERALEVLESAGSREAAESHRREASRLSNEQGLVLLSLGREGEALDRFAKSVALDPENPAPRANQGLVEDSRGHCREASRAYEAAARRTPLGKRAALMFFASIAAERARGGNGCAEEPPD